MEVHHHSHNPKKFKEYITEFIMLFAAVTLGFFAENLREVQIEKHREISYLKNVHEDLQMDFQTIDTVYKANSIRLQVLDTLFQAIRNQTIQNEEIYYYVRNLALRSTFESSHVGFDQIKSAGGLRMIKSKEIILGIQKYEKMLSSVEKLENVRERSLEQARFKMAEVFDANVLYDMSANQGVGIMRFKRPEKADNLLQNKKVALNEMINLLAIGLNTNRYLNNWLRDLNKIGKELDQTIINEYGDKMH